MGLFSSIKKAAKSVGKAVAKTVGDPLQKVVRETVIAATSGTPLESVGYAATKVSARNPVKSITNVTKAAISDLGKSGALPGPLGTVAAKFGSGLVNSTTSKPKAQTKQMSAEAPKTSGAVHGVTVSVTTKPQVSREEFVAYAAKKETAGGVF